MKPLGLRKMKFSLPLICALLALFPMAASAQYTPLSPTQNGVQMRQALDQRFNGTVGVNPSLVLDNLGNVSGNITPNIANGQTISLVLAGNVTMEAPTNLPSGVTQNVTILIQQGINYSVTWTGTYIGAIPTQTATSGGVTVYDFLCYAGGSCYWNGGGAGGGGGGINPPVGQISGNTSAPLVRWNPLSSVSSSLNASFGAAYSCKSGLSITLPHATGTGQWIYARNIINSFTACTVISQSGDTINGQPSILLTYLQGAMFHDVTANQWAMFYDVTFPAGIQGMYTCMSATLDQTGRITAAATGPCTAIYAHTLIGASPTAAVNSAALPAVDVENQLLATNVTSMTLPAASAVADGEIIHWFVQQSASGGPYTLPSGTIGPLTAGLGTIVAAATGVTCPTIGTTQSASVPSELHIDLVYRAALTEWVVEACQGVR